MREWCGSTRGRVRGAGSSGGRAGVPVGSRWWTTGPSPRPDQGCPPAPRPRAPPHVPLRARPEPSRLTQHTLAHKAEPPYPRVPPSRAELRYNDWKQKMSKNQWRMTYFLDSGMTEKQEMFEKTWKMTEKWLNVSMKNRNDWLKNKKVWENMKICLKTKMIYCCPDVY